MASVAKGLTIYVNGVNLANALQQASAESQASPIDATVLSDTYRSYAQGFKNGMIKGNGVWDHDGTNLNKIHNILSSAFNNSTTVHYTSSLETFAIGGVAVMADCTEQKYAVNVQLDQLVMADFEMQSTTGIAYGKWYFNASVATTTTNGTSNDNAASTANGGLFQCHYQNTSATTITVKLQHSTDNSTWVDLSTITISSPGAGSFGANSATVAAGTTVNRYTRVIVTTAGGTAIVQAAFARR